MFARLMVWIGARRSRLARLTLILLVLVVGLQVAVAVPRDTDLEFSLGQDHDRVVELRVAYVQQGHELHGVRFGFPAGAPDRVRHTVSLPPGEFEIQLELRGRDGHTRRVVRPLVTPTDGLVRYRLKPQESS